MKNILPHLSRWVVPEDNFVELYQVDFFPLIKPESVPKEIVEVSYIKNDKISRGKQL